MRILLLSLNFAPEPTGIGKYSGELARGLVARGHEVDVVCAPAYYPTWRFAEARANRYRLERSTPGLRVWRCPVWLPRRLNALTRIGHLLSFSVTAAPLMLGLALGQADVVFVVAPSLASAPLGWLASRLSGAVAWLHVQDFELEAAYGLGILRNGRLKAVLSAFERRLFAQFDVVSTISRRMRARLHQCGIEPGRTRLLPNWVELNHLGEREPQRPQRLPLGHRLRGHRLFPQQLGAQPGGRGGEWVQLGADGRRLGAQRAVDLGAGHRVGDPASPIHAPATWPLALDLSTGRGARHRLVRSGSRSFGVLRCIASLRLLLKLVPQLSPARPGGHRTHPPLRPEAAQLARCRRRCGTGVAFECQRALAPPPFSGRQERLGARVNHDLQG